MDSIEIEVINWEKYNPRTDRKKSSWFRLENSIAAEPKFFGLSASQKFVAICIFAEASKKCGAKATINIPWLADQLKIKAVEIHKTIQHLVLGGVVVVSSGVAEVSSGCPTNERTNERTGNESFDSLPPAAEIWNTCVKKPKITKWGKDRDRLAGQVNVIEWAEACAKIAKSDFLLGRNPKKWRATFDWLLKPANLRKVLEGNYDQDIEDEGGGFVAV